MTQSLLSARDIQAVMRPSPFNMGAVTHVARAGQSIADILCGFPGLPPEVWTHGVVLIGDHEISRELWHRVKPKAGSRHLLKIVVRPAGSKSGSSGGKNAFALIATIALFVVASAITGGAAAGAFGTTLFAAGSTSASLLAAGVSLVGALAISALNPPPSPSKAADDKGAVDTLGTASIGGNAVGIFDPIPFVVGTHRVTPPHLVPPWNESINDDQFVNAIIGLNGAHTFSDIRINDAPIDSFQELEYEVRDVVNDDSDLTIITKQVFQTDVGSELPGHKVNDDVASRLQDPTTPSNSYPTWQVARSNDRPDEIWLSFLWSGLVNQDTGGGTTPGGVGMRVRMRQVGDVAWINLPEFHAQREKLEPFRGTIKLRWAAVDSSLPAIDQNQSRPPWKYAFYAQNAQNAEGFDTNSYFAPGAGILAGKVLSEDGVAVVFLDEATFPKGTYEIQVQRGYGYKQSDFTTSTYKISSATPFFFTHTPSSSPPSIPKDQSKVPTKISWQAISSVWNEYPLREKGLSLLAIRAKNTAISKLTMLAQGWANTWDGTDWDTFEPTNNPAAWWRALALGQQSIRTPLIEAQLDDDTLTDWYDYCGSKKTIGRTISAPTTYYKRAGGLSSAADSKEFLFSAWIKRGNDNSQVLAGTTTLNGGAAAGASRFGFGGGSGSNFVALMKNAAGTDILNLTTANSSPPGTWRHYLCSVNLSNPTATWLYVNDVLDMATPSPRTNDFVDWTLGDFGIGGFANGEGRFEGEIAELYLHIGASLDLSVEANRRKFISANGRPVYLGAAGELPTGGIPILFLSGNDGDFGTNQGYGGGVTAIGSPAAVTLMDEGRFPTRESNAFFSGEKSLGDALKIIAGCGNAAGRISDKVGVILEKDRSAEGCAAVFNQRNSKGLTIKRAFPRVPDGLRCRFADEGNDYKPAEIIVYRNPQGQEIEAIDYLGITNPARIRERANLDLKQLLRRAALYSLECDIQQLYCTKGTLVSLTHDTLSRHFDGARALSATLSGGNLATLTLDSTLRLSLIGAVLAPDGSEVLAPDGSPVVWPADYPAGVIIQLKDGSTLTLEIDETDDASTVTFTDPPPLPSMFTSRGAWTTSTAYDFNDVVTDGGVVYAAIATHTSSAGTRPVSGASWVGIWEELLKDCLVAAGPFSSVEKRMLVLGIKPQNDMTASLTLVDEAAPLPLLSAESDGEQQITVSGEPVYTPI